MDIGLGCRQGFPTLRAKRKGAGQKPSTAKRAVFHSWYPPLGSWPKFSHYQDTMFSFSCHRRGMGRLLPLCGRPNVWEYHRINHCVGSLDEHIGLFMVGNILSGWRRAGRETKKRPHTWGTEASLPNSAHRFFLLAFCKFRKGHASIPPLQLTFRIQELWEVPVWAALKMGKRKAGFTPGAF